MQPLRLPASAASAAVLLAAPAVHAQSGGALKKIRGLRRGDDAVEPGDYK